MEGRIFDASGSCFGLPPLLSWDISHGFCSPCDSFEVRFLYSPEMLEPLKAACRFTAVHENETVFRGVADELELLADPQGCTAVLRGRGLQALLMDSEAESADYLNADAAFILAHHVTPLGITELDRQGVLPGKKATLSVSSGESHWSVLSRYAEFCLGLRPRFRPDGTLVLDGGDSGRLLRIGKDTPVGVQRYVQDRYGVLSEVLVKNRVLGTAVTVENAPFQAMGGRCGRVVNVPRHTGFDAMRHTGKYQIEKSMAGLESCRVTLPWLFAAFPGDRVLLEDTPLGISGMFRTEASRCIADGKSAQTVLTLCPDRRKTNYVVV